MTTLELLQQRWRESSITLSQVREAYFTHIKTDKRLRALIRSNQVRLRTFKLTESRLEPHRVRLADLAAYLDSRDEETA